MYSNLGAQRDMACSQFQLPAKDFFFLFRSGFQAQLSKPPAQRLLQVVSKLISQLLWQMPFSFQILGNTAGMDTDQIVKPQPTPSQLRAHPIHMPPIGWIVPPGGDIVGIGPGNTPQPQPVVLRLKLPVPGPKNVSMAVRIPSMYVHDLPPCSCACVCLPALARICSTIPVPAAIKKPDPR